jgi:hypothetical protein
MVIFSFTASLIFFDLNISFFSIVTVKPIIIFIYFWFKNFCHSLLLNFLYT